MKRPFYDFFAGAGLTTLALHRDWQCIWANDIAPEKAAVYRANHGANHFVLGDVESVTPDSLPQPVDMAWASFPCQDLSLAGGRSGLAGKRSGTFWAFWRLMHELGERRPRIIVLENVVGLLHDGGFGELCRAIAALNMQLGAMVIDARRFVAQSRPRVFLVAVENGVPCLDLALPEPTTAWTPRALLNAYSRLPADVQSVWRWWALPVPEGSSPSLSEVVEDVPREAKWHSKQQTAALLSMMSTRNQNRMARAHEGGGRQIGFLYKRIRGTTQRAEVRFDGIAGCLRTPGGGSSRQTVIIVEKGGVRSRLLTAREAARLMGAPDSFVLPERYNDAYKAMGDGVAVPVVSWLSEHLLCPLAEAATLCNDRYLRY